MIRRNWLALVFSKGPETLFTLVHCIQPDWGCIWYSTFFAHFILSVIYRWVTKRVRNWNLSESCKFTTDKNMISIEIRTQNLFLYFLRCCHYISYCVFAFGINSKQFAAHIYVCYKVSAFTVRTLGGSASNIKQGLSHL